ncbi:KxYKxGKxW signal peptide domain-containing protein [Streptococcus suis]|uniref:KxYKxGKxW signal peptide domain-containing protein n=1 Tax=Streptococcus suis TaxID=1307 RepID=UPI002FC6448A
MNRQRFSKNFDEIDRKSQVKMYKAGKNWVRKVISQISLLRVIRSRDDVTANISTVENRDCLDNRCHEYLKSILALGAAITGTSVSPTAFAEEYPLVVEQEVESSIDTLVDKDVVIVERVSSEIIVDSHLLISTDPSPSSNVNQSIDRMVSASGSESVSASSSASGSESVSASSSASGSESVSASSSVSGSESASVSSSVSSSESVSASSSVSSSESVSASSSVSGSESVSASELVSTSVRESLSTSESEPLNANGTVNKSETIRIAAELEYTTLDNAIRNLRHALSFPEIFEETGNEEKYGKYRQALSLARLALEQAIALREKDSVSQVELDAMALKAGQAAISLNGRIAQINPITAVEGTSTRATDTVRPEILKTNDLIIFNKRTITTPLVFGEVREASNPSSWKDFGINYASNTYTADSIKGGNNILLDFPGLQVRHSLKTGTRDVYQITISGTATYKQEVNGRTYFTRAPYIVDGAGNIPLFYVNGAWKESKIIIVEVEDGNHYINMNWGEAVTSNKLTEKASLHTKAGNPWTDKNVLNNIVIRPTGQLPAVNESKNVAVDLSVNGQSNTATANIYVNYPPQITTASNMYVFKGESVNRQLIQITESGPANFGGTVKSATFNTDVQGLTISTTGLVQGTVHANATLGRYTRTVSATDNLNNTNTSNSFGIYYMDLTGGELTSEIGTKITNDQIRNLLLANLQSGGESVSSNVSFSIPDHEMSLGIQTINVVATGTNGNSKTVQVKLNYRDTQAPTVTRTQSVIYVFDNVPIKLLNPNNPQAVSPVADKLKIATVTDVSGVATTADILTAVEAENDNKKGLTVTVEGSTASPKEVFVSGQTAASFNLPSGFYNNFVKIADTQGNATTYQTESAKFKMHLLDTSVTPIVARDIDATGFTRVTAEDILNAVNVDYGAVTQDEQNAVKVRKELLSNSDTGDRVTLGTKRATVRVYTASNTYKDVDVTFDYVDRTRPRITVKKDVSVFANRPVELIEPNTAAPVIATDSSMPLTYSMPDASGVTVNSTTGKVQGTLSATGAGYYTRAVTVLDAQNNSITSGDFWIRSLFINNMGSDGTITALEREYGLVPTADDIKNHVTITGVDNNGPTITKEVLGTIPKNVNGHVQVQLTTSEGVRTVVTVPINYTNQRPIINVPARKEILRKPVGQATTIDLSEGVTVSDREDDRSPSDNLMTSVKYEIVDSTNQVVRTVGPSTASKIVDLTDLPAGDYTVKISATDSGATTPVVATYPLRVNVDTTPPTVANAKSDIFVFKGVAIDTDATVTGEQPLKWATISDDIAVTDIVGRNNLVGLSLDLNGNLTGISNSTAGYYSRSLTVTDGTNSATAVSVRIFVLEPSGETTTRIHGHHVRTTDFANLVTLTSGSGV